MYCLLCIYIYMARYFLQKKIWTKKEIPTERSTLFCVFSLTFGKEDECSSVAGMKCWPFSFLFQRTEEQSRENWNTVEIGLHPQTVRPSAQPWAFRVPTFVHSLICVLHFKAICWLRNTCCIHMITNTNRRWREDEKQDCPNILINRKI